MWDAKKSCEVAAYEQLAANNRLHSTSDIVSQLPHSYYKNNNAEEKIVVDKCRTWTHPDNTAMLDDFLSENTKIIVMVRPIVEVVRSFVKVFKSNGVYTEQRERDLLLPNSEPLMRSLAGVQAAIESNSNRFIFISYQQLVEETSQTLKNIYSFCGWDSFIHNTSDITAKYAENDYVYGLEGLHTMRKKVSYCVNDTLLLDETVKQCEALEKIMHLKQNKTSWVEVE